MSSKYDYIRNFKSGKKISEILHDAADKHLASHPYNYDTDNQSAWSCLAILHSLLSGTDDICVRYEDYNNWKRHNSEYKLIIQGLYNIGLRTQDGMGTIFAKENNSLQRQQTRYGWLKMAAMLAEEQESRGEI
jgi:hypothetical protein